MDRAILDKEVVVGAGAVIGYGDDGRTEPAASRGTSRRDHGGGQAGPDPAGLRQLGRNVRVDADVVEADFEHVPHVDGMIPIGETVLAPSRRESTRPRTRTA